MPYYKRKKGYSSHLYNLFTNQKFIPNDKMIRIMFTL